MSDHSIAERFNWLWRISVAHFLTACLLLLGLVSFSIPYAGQVKPFFVLMAVYYWAVYRPTLIPPAFVFIIGILIDLISGAPYLGLSAILLLAVQWIVRDQRLYLMGQPFVMIWLGFLVTCLVAALVEWLLFSFLSLSLPEIVPVFAAVILSVLIFPALALVFHLVHRILPVRVKKFS